MSAPVLDLGHEWHRQRTSLRTARQRPPPLVAAGLDMIHEPETGRQVKMGGLAVIFGTFPASLEEFTSLARTRLHLAPEQAKELDPVLNTRLMAMWAWLPSRRQDCYLEFDRATGVQTIWLIGPGDGEVFELDQEADRTALDHAFLEALVLNGPGHWGGETGLVRLIERFGQQPLLIAAQVADALEHHAKEPRRALALAQEAWPDLEGDTDAAWLALVGRGHPWVQVQLGRLALRLGLVRPARRLLAAAGGAVGSDCGPVAWFDLGQACEALEELPAAEQAFTRYAALRPADPDAWRRLLGCRLRLGNLHVADETLRRYRAAGGKDADLVDRYHQVALRARLPLLQRARLAAWFNARLVPALDLRLGLEALVAELSAMIFPGAEEAFHEAVAAAVTAVGPVAARTVLCALPLHGGLHRDEADADAPFLAAAAAEALSLHAELLLEPRLPAEEWLPTLATLAHAGRRRFL